MLLINSWLLNPPRHTLPWLRQWSLKLASPASHPHSETKKALCLNKFKWALKISRFLWICHVLSNSEWFKNSCSKWTRNGKPCVHQSTIWLWDRTASTHFLWWHHQLRIWLIISLSLWSTIERLLTFIIKLPVLGQLITLRPKRKARSKRPKQRGMCLSLTWILSCQGKNPS